MRQTYSTVRNVNNKSILGLTDAKTNKPYVVGFPKHDLARRMCSWLPSEPVMKLQRKTPDNLTADFNSALSDVGLERFTVDKLTVDYTAHLVVPKRRKGDIDDIDALIDNYRVMNIPASDFLLYPFERSVGLILPTDCIKETRNEITFQAMVIDPCFNADLFKKSLQ